MADEQNTAVNQFVWLLKVSQLPTGALPLPESAKDMLKPIDDDGSDDNRLVTLEVAVMAQVLLANHLRYRLLPSFWYSWLANTLSAHEQVVQGYGTAVNIIIETPYVVQKLLDWLKWITAPFLPELPKLGKLFVQFNTIFRLWLDAVVIVNRERIATVAARDINSIAKRAFTDLRGSVMHYEPTGSRHRKIVSSRN